METQPASTAHKIRVVLDRTAKIKLAFGAVISTVLALMDSVAVVLVLPLVNLASGANYTNGAIGTVWGLLGKPDRTTLGLILVIAVVGIFVLKDLAFIAFTWWQSGVIARERVRLSSQILRNVLQSDYVSFRNRNISDVMALMSTAVGQAMNSGVNGLLQMFTAGVTILFLVIVLLVSTPVQAIFALLYFGIAGFVYLRVMRPKLNSVGESLWRGSLALTYAQLQALNGFKEVKLRHSSEVFVQRYRTGADETEQASRRGNFISGITKYLMEILFILGVGVLLIASFATSGGAEIVGSLALFVAAGFRMLPNISALIGSMNAVRMGLPSLEHVFREVDGPTRHTVGPNEG